MEGDNSGSNLGKRKSVTSTTPKGKKVKAEGKEKSEWWQYYEVLKHITQSCKQNPTRLEDKQGTLQFKLDNSVEGGTSSVATWKHDDDRIYKALIKLFVIGELPFAFVKNEAFVEYTQALNASHKGDDIGRKLLTCITEWGLKNVMTIAVDNASTNNKALDYLGLTEFSNPIERVTKAVRHSEYSNDLEEVPNYNHFEILDVGQTIIDKRNQKPTYNIMASKMKQKYDDYWGKLEEINDFMYFAVLLDPTKKCHLLAHGFRKIISYDISKEKPIAIKNMRARLEEIVEGSYETETELDRYLREPKIELRKGQSLDILQWWKVNGPRFPIVSKMARGTTIILYEYILAIQIFNCGNLKAAFSTCGRVLDPYRTRLSTTIVEALICTQDWVRKSRTQINWDDVEDLIKDDEIVKDMEEQLEKLTERDKAKQTGEI
ncbi:zinc finger BED domain-containing protein RICESLEEPER 2 [Tanacetum coccineum]